MSSESNGLNWWRDQILRDRERNRIAREQYTGNIRLMAAVIIGAMVWYYAHVEPILQGSTLLGTPLTLWALLRLIQSFLPRSSRWSSDPHGATQHILAQPNARRNLYFASGVVAILLLTTSSVFLEYDNDDGTGEYIVEVYRDDNLVMPEQKVTSYSPKQGKVFFFRFISPFNPIELRFDIVEPPYRYDFKLLTKRWPWSNRIEVPGDFKTKQHRVFRLIPDGDRWMKLPVRGDDPSDAKMRLAVSVGQANGELELFKSSFFFEPVYFGGPPEMIDHFRIAEQETKEDRWNLVGHLKNRLSDTMFERNSDALMQNQTIQETIEIDQGATLIVRVLLHDPDNDSWNEITKFDYVVKPDGGVQNIFIPD